MTGTVRQILLQHFADANNVMNQHLRERLQRDGVWQPGPESSLYIESLSLWRPDITEARPALLIKEGDWNWWRASIGDSDGVDWRSGKASFFGYWKGSHTVFAVGREAAETQLLAVEVAKVLLYFGPMIFEQLALHRFVMLQIGALRAIKESTENYIVPVSFGYVAEERWSLQADAPRLKRVHFNTDDMLL
jgi:hypothetical protein